MSLEGGAGARRSFAFLGANGGRLAWPGPPDAGGGTSRPLDHWLREHPRARLDYIHGEEALGPGPGGEGHRLPAAKPEKGSLFATVQQEGALPRKTFSMGEAWEKRYYLETRRLMRP